MKETDLNKRVADWICSLIYKNQRGMAYKRHIYLDGTGHPDVTGCLCGIRIELEGKSEGKKPTKIQNKRLRQWSKAGAITGVYYSLEEAQKIVLDGLAERGVEIWKITTLK